MQDAVVKYSLIALLLLVYINRSLFIAPYEVENHGNNEVNSMVEWLIQLISGDSNDIDEDGDIQTDCNYVKIVLHDFSQQTAKFFELTDLSSRDLEKLTFPKKEDFPVNDFYSEIDHPPQVI